MWTWVWFGCGGEVVDAAECPPTTPLFGLPTEATGLGDDECGPSCGCGAGSFAPTALDPDALRAWTLLEPFDRLDADPYADPPDTAIDEDAVCAVVPEAAGYRLRDFPSASAATAAGAHLTHHGRCGVCSTLADLAVYASTPELTAPVRDCGLQNLGAAKEEHVACLLELGFTPPCADIWYYNTLNTSAECGLVCFAALDAPYNLPTGELNECLACDEEESGPVFAAVAGRTRRNTGVPSSICRPCEEVEPVRHDYGEPR